MYNETTARAALVMFVVIIWHQDLLKRCRQYGVLCMEAEKNTLQKDIFPYFQTKPHFTHM